MTRTVVIKNVHMPFILQHKEYFASWRTDRHVYQVKCLSQIGAFRGKSTKLNMSFMLSGVYIWPMKTKLRTMWTPQIPHFIEIWSAVPQMNHGQTRPWPMRSYHAIRAKSQIRIVYKIQNYLFRVPQELTPPLWKPFAWWMCMWAFDSVADVNVTDTETRYQQFAHLGSS